MTATHLGRRQLIRAGNGPAPDRTLRYSLDDKGNGSG